MKNQGGEAKAAPRPAGSSVAGGALLLEEGDTAEPTVALEGGEGTRGRGWGVHSLPGGAGKPRGRVPGLEAAGLRLLLGAGRVLRSPLGAWVRAGVVLGQKVLVSCNSCVYVGLK